MSNSRSIASARQRRSGEPPSQLNSSRPGTSMASQSAFATASPNVRIAKAPIIEQQAPIQPNGLPFTKLTVSDAIGLITLRLGKVEQFIIDMQVNGVAFNNDLQSNKVSIDNSVLTSIISRIDSLEKKQLNSNSSINSNANVALDNANSEKIGKIEKELRETKDLLISFIMKCDLLTRETGQRFSEIETAISGIEKYIQTPLENENTVISSNDLSEEIANDGIIQNVDETSQHFQATNETHETHETHENNEIVQNN
jgi:hypothetical protein